MITSLISYIASDSTIQRESNKFFYNDTFTHEEGSVYIKHSNGSITHYLDNEDTFQSWTSKDEYALLKKNILNHYKQNNQHIKKHIYSITKQLQDYLKSNYNIKTQVFISDPLCNRYKNGMFGYTYTQSYFLEIKIFDNKSRGIILYSNISAIDYSNKDTTKFLIKTELRQTTQGNMQETTRNKFHNAILNFKFDGDFIIQKRLTLEEKMYFI